MEIDCSLCIICQEKNSETLQCPLDNPAQKRNKSEAYEAFLKNVEEFRAIGALPLIVTVSRVLETINLQKTLHSIVRHCTSLVLQNLTIAS